MLPDAVGLVHVNTKDRRSRYREMLIQAKHDPHAALDEAQFQHAMLVNGALQLRRNRTRAVVRVAGNANRVPARVFDPVVTTLGLNIDQRAGSQTLKAYASRVKGCRHPTRLCGLKRDPATLQVSAIHSGTYPKRRSKCL